MIAAYNVDVTFSTGSRSINKIFTSLSKTEVCEYDGDDAIFRQLKHIRAIIVDVLHILGLHNRVVNGYVLRRVRRRRRPIR